LIEEYSAGKHPEIILTGHMPVTTLTKTRINGRKNYIVREKASNSCPCCRKKSCRGPLFIPLGKTGFQEIRSVEAAGQQKRWTDGMLKDELSHEHGFHFGVRMPFGKSLCAYVLCRVFAGELHIHRLCTRPAERRKGYAAALLAYVFAAAQKKGVSKVLLEVNASNGAAMSLYRRLGFKVDAERKKYYRDGHDALLMSRAL
jgi:ribosomal-protein-alanine N-acetyltransferase